MLSSKWAVLKTLKFWEFIVILITAIFIGKQIIDAQGQIQVLTQIVGLQGQLLQKTSNAASEELTMNLDDRLSSPVNTSIFKIMANNGILRQVNGGPFSDNTLDNFLGVYENLNDAYNAGLIKDDDLCNMFSDGLFTAAESAELNAYVAKSQKENPIYDTGYQNMVAVVSEKCN